MSGCSNKRNHPSRQYLLFKHFCIVHDEDPKTVALEVGLSNASFLLWKRGAVERPRMPFLYDLAAHFSVPITYFL